MQKVSAISVLILILIAGCAPRPPDKDLADSTAAALHTIPPRLAADENSTQTAANLRPSDPHATPFVFPAVFGASSICESAPPTYLILHERGQVTDDDPKPLNLRDAPSLEGERVAVLQTLDIFLVIDGPRCADNYTWFKVRAGGVEAWIAEGEQKLYYVQPYLH